MGNGNGGREREGRAGGVPSLAVDEGKINLIISFLDG